MNAILDYITGHDFPPFAAFVCLAGATAAGLLVYCVFMSVMNTLTGFPGA